MKKYDLVVKTSKYAGTDGTEKSRYENVGEIHSGRDDGLYARINPFRMMGVCMAALCKGQDSLVVSMYPPKEGAQTGGGGAAAQRQSPPDFDDHITF